MSNTVIRSYPRGLDTEVVRFHALEKAAAEAAHKYEREHVTPFIYRHPELFSLEQVKAPREHTMPDLRLSIDTIDDLNLMTALFKRLYKKNPFFSVDDVLSVIRREPELMQINAHVQQKTAF